MLPNFLPNRGGSPVGEHFDLGTIGPLLVFPVKTSQLQFTQRAPHSCSLDTHKYSVLFRNMSDFVDETTSTVLSTLSGTISCQCHVIIGYNLHTKLSRIEKIPSATYLMGLLYRSRGHKRIKCILIFKYEQYC